MIILTPQLPLGVKKQIDKETPTVFEHSPANHAMNPDSHPTPKSLASEVAVSVTSASEGTPQQSPLRTANVPYRMRTVNIHELRRESETDPAVDGNDRPKSPRTDPPVLETLYELEGATDTDGAALVGVRASITSADQQPHHDIPLLLPVATEPPMPTVPVLQVDAEVQDHSVTDQVVAAVTEAGMILANAKPQMDAAQKTRSQHLAEQVVAAVDEAGLLLASAVESIAADESVIDTDLLEYQPELGDNVDLANQSLAFIPLRDEPLLGPREAATTSTSTSAGDLVPTFASPTVVPASAPASAPVPTYSPAPVSAFASNTAPSATSAQSQVPMHSHAAEAPVPVPSSTPIPSPVPASSQLSLGAAAASHRVSASPIPPLSASTMTLAPSPTPTRSATSEATPDSATTSASLHPHILLPHDEPADQTTAPVRPKPDALVSHPHRLLPAQTSTTGNAPASTNTDPSSGVGADRTEGQGFDDLAELLLSGKSLLDVLAAVHSRVC